MAGVIGERNLFGVRFEEKIERVDHRDLGDQIDLDAEFVGFFGEDQSRQPITLRILLPIDKMLLGQDLERVSQDRCTAVWRRAQADDLRTQIDQAVIAIMGDVIQRDVNSHEQPKVR